jgi:hypothetical protein
MLAAVGAEALRDWRTIVASMGKLCRFWEEIAIGGKKKDDAPGRWDKPFAHRLSI